MRGRDVLGVLPSVGPSVGPTNSATALAPGIHWHCLRAGNYSWLLTPVSRFHFAADLPCDLLATATGHTQSVTRTWSASVNGNRTDSPKWCHAPIQFPCRNRLGSGSITLTLHGNWIGGVTLFGAVHRVSVTTYNQWPTSQNWDRSLSILSPTHASRAPTMQRAVATRHFGGAHNRIRDRADWCKVFHLSVFIFVLSVLFCCNYAHASMAMPSCLLTI